VWSSAQTNTTQCIALGDIDGDGDLDLVCGNGLSANTLYRNTDGSLDSVPYWTSSVAENTWSVALGDIDGDGDLDLACGNNLARNSVYDNIGNIFSAAPVWSSSQENSTVSIGFGDIDGDGDLDLVCGNRGANTVYQNAGGSFLAVPMWTSSQSNACFSVVLGDVDGDGDLDLACGNYEEANTLYENTGSALSFMPVWTSDPANRTREVVLGDVDGDGDLDLASGNFGNRVTLFENTAGAFAGEPAWYSGEANETFAVTLGDVDGDGDLDLVCGNKDQENTLYENGGSTFSTAPVWRSDSTFATFGVALADLDGGGGLDLVCGNLQQRGTVYGHVGSSLSTAPVWYSDSTFYTFAVALGDIDGDGDADLVQGNSAGGVVLFENIGGTFTAKQVWTAGQFDNTRAVALGDIDGDGDLDLACGNYNRGATVYENTGGTFARFPIWTAAAAYPTFGAAFGDIDGDGDPDLVFANYNQSNMMYENIGGAFAHDPAWSSAPAYSSYTVSPVDADGDGDLDLLFGNKEHRITLYANIDGELTLSPVWSSDQIHAVRAAAVGDVDGDGDDDLVCGTQGGFNVLFEGTRNPPYGGDPLSPTDHIPNNGAFVRSAAVIEGGTNRKTVELVIADVEADRIWIIAEYQFAGERIWRPAETPGGINTFGPMIAPPDGAIFSFQWDITTVPFDRGDVVLRFRTVEIPTRVSTIRHAQSFTVHVGRIIPNRPEIASTADTLTFPTVTVGDTVHMDLVVSNRGTLDLTINGISPPSGEIQVDIALPLLLGPGESRAVPVILEPRLETEISGVIAIASDDPLTPIHTIEIVTDIRGLEISSKLLSSQDRLPLGEAVTVVIAPAPRVHVEQGYLHHRPTGSTAFNDSIPISPFEEDFVAVIPGEAVTEAGLEYFIRVENSGVFGSDPAGAPAVFHAREVTAPGGIATEPIPNAGLEFLAGRDIRVVVILPIGAEFLSGALHYRLGGSAAYTIDSLGLGDVFPQAMIPDSMTGARGIEYWVDVHTRSAHLFDPPLYPDRNPHYLRMAVQNFVESHVHSGGESAAAYRIMSIPLQFREDFSGTIEALLSDQAEFGSYDPLRWRAWTYLRDTGTYGELSDQSLAALFRPEPGRAFWLICAVDHRITTAPIPGLSTAAHVPFGISLPAGSWSMVGHPYAFSVHWDSVLVNGLRMSEAVGVLIEPPLEWSGGFYSTAAVLEPFEGYWVFNRTDEAVTLRIPPEEMVGTAMPRSPAAEGFDGWRISIRVESEGTRDDPLTVGASTSADRGIDPFDRVKPPPAPLRPFSAYVLDEGAGSRYFRYAEDIRNGRSGSDCRGEVWELDIMKRYSSEGGRDEVTIAVDDAQDLPEGMRIALVDRALARAVDLRPGSPHSCYCGIRGYVTDPADARFSLIVGTEAYIAEETARQITLPVYTAVHQNYPNPFNPSTVIRYDVSRAGPVSLRIYDVSGALVKVLEAAVHVPGGYEVGWDGTNDRGERVATGVYFYRFATPEYRETRKMVLMR
jgi:hypothetical protein